VANGANVGRNNLDWNNYALNGGFEPGRGMLFTPPSRSIIISV